MFYDLQVYTIDNVGENSFEEIVEFAKKLGLGGLGIVKFHDEELEWPSSDLDIVKVVMIKPTSAEELGTIAKRIRNKAEILMVYGGDYDINRAACESPLIDILCHPELNRKDTGLDAICVKAAHDSDVSIEINFREVLESYKKRRVHILSAIKENVRLCKEYETNIITTSGARSKWDLRSGRELAAIAHILGLDLGKAISSVSTLPEKIVKENREKLNDKKWKEINIVEE